MCLPWRTQVPQKCPVKRRRQTHTHTHTPREGGSRGLWWEQSVLPQEGLVGHLEPRRLVLFVGEGVCFVFHCCVTWPGESRGSAGYRSALKVWSGEPAFTGQPSTWPGLPVCLS